MDAFDFDLFVIGAGSGGVRAARVASRLGARVAIAENHRLGGTCVIRGCVPKKLMVLAAHFGEDFEDAVGFGWERARPGFSWQRLAEARDREVARLSGIYERLLTDAGVEIVTGAARIPAPGMVAVGDRQFRCRHILIATGGWPFVPDIPGAEHAVTSNEVFELKTPPRRVLVVGGGYIAVEFAGIFHGLGAEVCLSYRGEQILRGFDGDVRTHLNEEMRRKGIDIALGSTVTAIRRRSDGLLDVDGENLAAAQQPFDLVMYATGRVPNTAGLGLEALGIETDTQGGIVVDPYGQTSVPGIHAVGDVTNRIALTPVAIREGQALAMTLFGGKPSSADHDCVPSAVFSQPPVATVGLSEEAALERHDEIAVYAARFRPMKHTLSGREERTLMKLVVDPVTDRVLGAHMVGPDAPEIIQGIAIAVKMGATKTDFDTTVGIHPTAAEEFVTLRDPVIKRRGV
ncbi:glutathione-disulfide reductase [Azoarcus taiwanensis]|uniref:Glutathione reductase n=1 Tax=Azoarcus taiwanensis TaxID=666964 RepID=A0A972FGV3_9RHOO|nr:glutathione-disulfide reductase [Azoarcus taiwanensis]NMG02086.1 glutathione-disulfide reductase [Azoarcus taiwanensis]